MYIFVTTAKHWEVLLVSGWCAVRGYVLVVMMTIIHITTLLRITPTLDKHPLPDHTPTTTSLGALMSPLHRWESLLFITLEFWNFRFYVCSLKQRQGLCWAYGLEMLCPGAGQVWAGGCSMAVVRAVASIQTVTNSASRRPWGSEHTLLVGYGQNKVVELGLVAENCRVVNYR